VGRVQGYGNKCRYSRLREPCQKPDSGPANVGKRLAARFYRLKTGLSRVGEEATDRQVLAVPLQDPATGASLQVLPTLETRAEKSCVQSCGERQAEAEAKNGSRSGTSLPMSAAASRSWSSCLCTTDVGEALGKMR